MKNGGRKLTELKKMKRSMLKKVKNVTNRVATLVKTLLLMKKEKHITLQKEEK